jgi:hypothetical protein
MINKPRYLAHDLTPMFLNPRDLLSVVADVRSALQKSIMAELGFPEV